LSQASMKLGEAMYAASQAEQASQDAAADAAAEAADSGDDVVDADFTEVDDDNSKKDGAA
jgi:molecular chaperone DnaK